MTFTSPDLLTRAFCLCICERLQSQLGSHHFSTNTTESTASTLSASDQLVQPEKRVQPGQVLLQLLADQLLQSRVELVDELEEEIGEKADWQTVSGLLVAYALLRPKTGQAALLQLYLRTRMDMVVASLQQPESTLLGVVRQMKDTVQCVEQVFSSGQALQSALQCVTQQGWSPAALQQLLDDLPLSSTRLLEAEVVHVNAGLSGVDKGSNTKNGASAEQVQQACAAWVVQMCAAASERVRGMCAYFERVDQAVEFAVAVSQIFKSDWPSALLDSNALIYRQLFGDALLQRFRHLIEQELRQLECQLHEKLHQTNCQPPPLFGRRAAAEAKFDTQLASGVSAELQELVQATSAQLHQLQQNVHKYTTVGQEAEVASLQDVLAEQVLAMVGRLTDFSEWQLQPKSTPISAPQHLDPSPGSSTAVHDQHTITSSQEKQRARWLCLFRLLLALVQHEPSALCQCMNRNLDRIVQCNRQLHAATEQALCNFMDCVLDECLSATNLYDKMLECCASWHAWLPLLQEPERVQLSETVQVQMPTQVSLYIYMFLAAICAELNQHSLGHLFTRNVTLHVSRRIGSLLSKLLVDCSLKCAPVPWICTQLLLDSKALFQMFPDQQFLEAAQKLEAKLDPIEGSVLQEPLARNAKLFAQRTSMLFGQLQAEPITAFQQKEAGTSGQAQLLPSYSNLVDLMPKVGDIMRLTQIPRLSKLKEDQSAEDGTGASREQKLAAKGGERQRQKPSGADGQLPGKAATGTAATNATASFSSLYDKISTGWFKS